MSWRWRFGRAEAILAGALAILGLGAYFVITQPAFAEWNVRIFEAWTEWAIRFGYFGAFLTALIGNLTVVIIFPYTLLVFFLATTGLDPFWLGLLTGVGAELGELSGFLLGRIGAGAIERRRPREYFALKRIVEHRPAVVPVLLFVFSLTPMPDDVLFIPLGLLRYPTWKLIVPSLLGKIGAGMIIAYTGSAVQSSLTVASAQTSLVYQFGTLGLLAALMYAVAKIPWQRVLDRMLATTSKQPPV